ncbi:hypothetical protein BTA51_13565 [Hahella sp. CCB-MM4]|uniref:hypothetical protein n=1 Tax=Hahella sp. (strain CCB-MM4) TaxID=1926491 RepID=UPI000B9ADA3C|nr:hypothetical protein [Hahella sp. CCB-MM4]OZG72979.1 hypothetical protein BTA51_13565 [Hahella sp. CCB-MM4]
MWPVALIIASILMIASVFIKALDSVAIIVARIIGGLSLAGLLLGILAGFIGGAFHLSESNQIVLVGLFVMALLGLPFFAFRIEPKDA